MVTLSLADARPTEATRAKAAEINNCDARRMNGSGEGWTPEHSIVQRAIVKNARGTVVPQFEF